MQGQAGGVMRQQDMAQQAIPGMGLRQDVPGQPMQTPPKQDPVAGQLQAGQQAQSMLKQQPGFATRQG
jgi:hypothetical protein